MRVDTAPRRVSALRGALPHLPLTFVKNALSIQRGESDFVHVQFVHIFHLLSFSYIVFIHMFLKNNLQVDFLLHFFYV